MTDIDAADPSAIDKRSRAESADVLVIQPTSGWRSIDVAELWKSRELIFFLAWRDVQVRYKQTVFGALWAVMQPIAGMLVFSIIFGTFARIPSQGVPYHLFALTGLLPWMYFANSVVLASFSLVANTNLVSKIYFPRLAIPLSGVLSGLVDLSVGAVALLFLLWLNGNSPLLTWLLVPLLVLHVLLAAFAVSVWLAAVNVQYRDVRNVIPFVMQLWIFASPVVYPLELVPENLRLLYGLNPMVGVLEGFRWAILGTQTEVLPLFAISMVSIMILLLSGVMYFRRVERTFADVI